VKRRQRAALVGPATEGAPLHLNLTQCGCQFDRASGTKEQGNETVGNSTEGALLLWLNERGLKYETIRASFPPLLQMPFNSERKRMTTVVEQSGRRLALVKGAPEWCWNEAVIS